MKRLRDVRSWGGTHIIPLTKTDMKDMELKEGDLVDISLLKKEKKDE